ncbi:MAG TPA: TRAP transporter small permease [Candidatus Bathyarchaeia archaeon]|nr:TRAP transporter small permease [Candidatus Bathyarchaeia archaeon]
MANSSGFIDGIKSVDRVYVVLLRAVVMALAAASGLAIIAMIAVTSADVLMRVFGRSLTGAYDIVKIAGAITIACALPYTTAVKGHIAIEFFFQKLRRPGRILVDTLTRLMVIAFFVVVARQTIIYGNTLKRTGEVSLTLQIPVYWVAYVIAGALAITVLVKIYNLLHPGREMIKP